MNTKNQSEQAYDRLSRSLLAKRIRPGERLVESFWAKELNVNRGDIRLALVRLEAEGLITKGHRGGLFAREYTEKDVRQTNEARLLLEKAAASLAIDRASDQDILRLEKILTEMREMANNGYRLGVAEADLRFHEALVEAAHNDVLTKIYRQAGLPITERPLTGLNDEEITKQHQADLNEHERILAALKNKKIDLLLHELENGMCLDLDR